MPFPVVAARRVARLVPGAGIALVLAVPSACSEDDAATTRSDTQHNAADVAFAQAMIPHHAQAMTMVDLLRGRRVDPAVEALGEQIRDAQGQEIEILSDWLVEWDEEVPETMRDHSHAGHDGADPSEVMEQMGAEHDDMPGMMSAQDFKGLEEADDAAFQDRWLALMIEHHEGALEMAETEREEGRFAPAVELAGEVVASQDEEIETMQELIDR